MKWKFTYKEFSLLLGILVAIIIMLTIWLRPPAAESGEVSQKLIPSLSKPVKAAAVKIIGTFQQTLE